MNDDNYDDNDALEEPDDCSREYEIFRSKRLPFSLHDDQLVLDWIIKNQAFHLVHGNVIWKRMEQQNLVNKRTWESLKERFQTHISLHLNQYKLSRSNIWRIELGLGVLEDVKLFCDTDMEDESSLISDTAENQKMFRKRITNQPVVSTESNEDEDIGRKNRGGRSRTRRSRRKYSRYKDSNYPQPSNPMQNSSNVRELSNNNSNVEERMIENDTKSNDNVKDSSSTDDDPTNPYRSNIKDVSSCEVFDDRLREESDTMKEMEQHGQFLDDFCEGVENRSIDNNLNGNHQDELQQDFDLNFTRDSNEVDLNGHDDDEDSTITKYSSPMSSLATDGGTSHVLDIEANVRYEEDNEATLVVKGLPDEINLKKIEIVQTNGVRSFNVSPEPSGNDATNQRKIGKYWNFVQEPMGNKDVTDLAGIGQVLGRQLKRKGFDKAFEVFGKFLLLKKNKESFVDWIQEITKANIKQAGDCYQCLYVWCQEFL